MFLRIAMAWAKYGPKEMEDLAFEFDKVMTGANFRRPR